MSSYKPAGFGQRLLANIIDVNLSFLSWFIISLFIISPIMFFVSNQNNLGFEYNSVFFAFITTLMILSIVLVPPLYFAYFGTRGGEFGKKWVGVKLIYLRTNKEPDFLNYYKRELIKVLTIIIFPLYLINIVVYLTSNTKQS